MIKPKTGDPIERAVTKSTIVVTKLVNVTKRAGRPPRHGKAMTDAERQRAHRARKANA